MNQPPNLSTEKILMFHSALRSIAKTPKDLYDFFQIFGEKIKNNIMKNEAPEFQNLLQNPVSSHFSFFGATQNQEFQNLILNNDQNSIFFRNLFSNAEIPNLGTIIGSGKQELEKSLDFIEYLKKNNLKNIKDEEILEFFPSEDHLEYFELVFQNQDILKEMMNDERFLYILENPEISNLFKTYPDLDPILRNNMEDLIGALNDENLRSFLETGEQKGMFFGIFGAVFGALILSGVIGYIIYKQPEWKNQIETPKVFFHKKQDEIQKETFNQFKEFFLKMTNPIDEKGKEKNPSEFLLLQTETSKEIYETLEKKAPFSQELKEKIANEILGKSNITMFLYNIFDIKVNSVDLIFNSNKITLKDFLINLEKNNPEIQKFNQTFREELFKQLDSFGSLDQTVQTKMILDNTEILIEPKPKENFYLTSINDNLRQFIIDSLEKMFQERENQDK